MRKGRKKSALPVMGDESAGELRKARTAEERCRKKKEGQVSHRNRYCGSPSSEPNPHNDWRSVGRESAGEDRLLLPLGRDRMRLRDGEEG